MKVFLSILSAIICCLQLNAQQEIFLVGRTIGYNTMYDGDSVRIFGFNENLFDAPLSPGPTLYMHEGDSVEIEFFNFSQGAPHTIHLHGLDVDQENDGVPSLSFEVHHMESGFYNFKAPHAGTYLYHCHVVSAIHVQAGMYGLVVVRPPDGSFQTWEDGYSYHQEHSFLLSEIDPIWHEDETLDHEYDSSLTMNHVPLPLYNPQYFLVNGLSEQQLENEGIETSMNAVNYLRFANVGYCGNRVQFPEAMNAKIVSSDGRPLPEVEESDFLEIYPGERYGVITESSMEFQDSIAIEYFDLNTMSIKNVQHVDVSVEGIVGFEKEFSANEIELWPNPANDKVSIHVPIELGPNPHIEVLNFQGQRMEIPFTKDDGLNSLLLRADLRTLPNGLYLVQVWTENTRETLKLIKR